MRNHSTKKASTVPSEGSIPEARALSQDFLSAVRIKFLYRVAPDNAHVLYVVLSTAAMNQAESICRHPYRCGGWGTRRPASGSRSLRTGEAV